MAGCRDGYFTPEDEPAILEQIKVALDRTSFELSGSDRVLFMQRTDDFANQNDDGLWRMVVDFRLTVYLASGA